MFTHCKTVPSSTKVHPGQFCRQGSQLSHSQLLLGRPQLLLHHGHWSPPAHTHSSPVAWRRQRVCAVWLTVSYWLLSMFWRLELQPALALSALPSAATAAIAHPQPLQQPRKVGFGHVSQERHEWCRRRMEESPFSQRTVAAL